MTENQPTTEVNNNPYKPSSPASKLDFESVWEYADAPQSADSIELKDQYDLFIGGEFVKPDSGNYFDSINPANEQKLSSIAEANQEDIDKAVQAARNAHNGPWSSISAKERGKYVFRLARLIQERAREFAIIESMDGGKPIRESRDVDIPLAAAHFFYYAGWADKLNYAFPNREVESSGRCRADYPLELSAAYAGLENCTSTGYRQYGCT